MNEVLAKHRGDPDAEKAAEAERRESAISARTAAGSATRASCGSGRGSAVRRARAAVPGPLGGGAVPIPWGC